MRKTLLFLLTLFPAIVLSQTNDSTLYFPTDKGVPYYPYIYNDFAAKPLNPAHKESYRLMIEGMRRNTVLITLIADTFGGTLYYQELLGRPVGERNGRQLYYDKSYQRTLGKPDLQYAFMLRQDTIAVSEEDMFAIRSRIRKMHFWELDPDLMGIIGPDGETFTFEAWDMNRYHHCIRWEPEGQYQLLCDLLTSMATR